MIPQQPCCVLSFLSGLRVERGKNESGVEVREWQSQPCLCWEGCDPFISSEALLETLACRKGMDVSSLPTLTNC